MVGTFIFYIFTPRSLQGKADIHRKRFRFIRIGET